MDSSIGKDFTITTSRCRLAIPAESDIPYVFAATRVAGFNDGMAWDPPAAIEELYEPYRKSLNAWDAVHPIHSVSIPVSLAISSGGFR